MSVVLASTKPKLASKMLARLHALMLGPCEICGSEA